MQKNTRSEFEKITDEFLLLVRKCIRHYYKPDTNEGNQKYDRRELQLMDEFFKIKSEVNAALYNADMKIIASKMCQLIVLGEEYINEMEEKSKIPNCLLLRNIAAYMISLLKAFGIIPKNFDNAFAIDSTETVICGISPSTSAQEIIMPYVSALTVFRKTISELAQQHNVTDIIKECDRIRDKVLPELGIILNEANPEEPVLINVSALKHWKIDGDNNTNKERERE